MAAPATPGQPAQGPNEFDLARNRASQQNNAAVQAQKDAFKRRAAAGGNLNSGAFIKQETQVDQQGQQNLQQANETIDTAQRGENRRLAEVKEGRDFARGEREASQAFASGESAMQRKYMTSERMGSQDFAKSQQAAEISARYDLQAKQIASQVSEGKLNREQANAQLEHLKAQSKIEFDEAQKVNMVTTALSAKNSGLSPWAVEALVNVYSNPGATLPAGWPNQPAAPAAATASGHQSNTSSGGNTSGGWRPGGSGG